MIQLPDAWKRISQANADAYSKFIGENNTLDDAYRKGIPVREVLKGDEDNGGNTEPATDGTTGTPAG